MELYYEICFQPRNSAGGAQGFTALLAAVPSHPDWTTSKHLATGALPGGHPLEQTLTKLTVQKGTLEIACKGLK